jgi:hypothetical protein
VARLAGCMALLGAVAVEPLRDLAQPASALPVRDPRGTDADTSKRGVIQGEHKLLMRAMPRDRK